MKESNDAGGGIGFCGALTLLFVGLKLTGHIDWPWWWVTAPLWGGLAIFLAVVVVMFVVTLWSAR